MGFADGMRAPLDAVEATIRQVEATPSAHSVGLGGVYVALRILMPKAAESV